MISFVLGAAMAGCAKACDLLYVCMVRVCE